MEDYTDNKIINGNTSDDLQNLLEDMATESLLVELFNAKKAEVFEGIVFEGQRRYYVEDLSQRDYTLESTTPYQIDILGHVIDEHTWVHLIRKITELLLSIFPDFRDKIVDFQCPWSKAKMITNEPRTNYRPIADDLYVNCNHTALHSCWVIQDLLDFFGVDKSTVSFLIHRPSGAEPKHVKEYIENRFKRNYALFIQRKTNKGEEYSDKVIRLTEKYLNSKLRKVSKSYTNLFLFDDNATLSNYVKKIREMITVDVKLDEKNKRVLNKYLDYLVEFYKEKH